MTAIKYITGFGSLAQYIFKIICIISMKSKIITFQKYWLHGLNINDLSDEDFRTEIVFTTTNAIGSVSIPVVLTEEKGWEFFIICKMMY
jgi:hypothetical protein